MVGKAEFDFGGVDAFRVLAVASVEMLLRSERLFPSEDAFSVRFGALKVSFVLFGVAYFTAPFGVEEALRGSLAEVE